MSNNKPETMTYQQRYCNKNDERCLAKKWHYCEENKERLQKIAYEQYKTLSEEEVKKTMLEVNIRMSELEKQKIKEYEKNTE